MPLQFEGFLDFSLVGQFLSAFSVRPYGRRPPGGAAFLPLILDFPGPTDPSRAITAYDLKEMLRGLHIPPPFSSCRDALGLTHNHHPSR